MNLLRSILNRHARYSTRLCAFWHRQRFLFTEIPRHKRIELGQNVEFFVPMKGGGEGTLSVGDGTKFGVRNAYRAGKGEIMLQARLPATEIVIGKNNWFNNNTVLCAMQSIKIGDNCRIGDFVSIIDADFHEINPDTRNRSEGVVKPVIVGDNVWIGSRVMVLKGVHIGDNSVVGAMSLVTKDVPANCVAAGVPARVIRKIE